MMNTLQQKIALWLSRGGPARSLNQCFDLPIVLSTDIGLVRSENQDRVAAIRIGNPQRDADALIAIAVADGMGGMRDGGKCATLALSSFFYSLLLYRNKTIQQRALAAISYANNEVFNFANGKGGSTLSAVLVGRGEERQPLIVNLGDSRIYAFSADGDVERLTRDDSLAEAVGGHGRELLQFVGMGKGMQPHIQAVPNGTANLAITTDGIHFVEPSTFERILSNSPELRSASDRLSALARWCGGPDNASVAMMDLHSLITQTKPDSSDLMEVWDPFGSLTALWVERDFALAQANGAYQVQEPVASQAGDVSAPPAPRAKQRTVKSKRSKKVVAPKEDIQLEIQIERSLAVWGRSSNAWILTFNDASS